MASKKLKIVQITSEIDPFSKTGGLADVTSSLTKAISELGHDVIVITPLYGQSIDIKKHKLELVYEKVKVILNSEDLVVVNYWKGYLRRGLPVYFIESKKYFSQKESLYCSSKDNARFLVFDVAALKLISLLKFDADIVHCHDWQTGLIPYYLKTDFRYSKTLRKAKTLYTIHNLIFQFGHDWWEIPYEKKDYGRTRIPHLDDESTEFLNFAKRAILSADAINTVSEQYREEIMTKKFGQDLNRILKNREDRLFGIVNGIDYKEYNPENDPGLFANYKKNETDIRSKNKEKVQKLFDLPANEKIPLICTTSRITFQKGFVLIVEILESLLKNDIQLVMIGAGDKKYISILKKLARRYPKKLGIIDSHEMNQKYETFVYSGSDLILLPSHVEPCGINQMIAMRYGCVPVVRRVGGLQDTVSNFNPTTKKGNGFTFKNFDKFALYGCITRAIETMKYREVWRGLVLRAMRESNSWEIPAKKYVNLYRKIIRMNGQ